MRTKVIIIALSLIVGFPWPAAASRWTHFLPLENVTWVEYDSIAQTYWFGTENNGLWRFDGRDFEHLTLSPRVYDQGVTALAIDEKKGALWIGTRTGLFRYYVKSGIFEHYDSQSGLAADWITALLVGIDGTIWYGSQFDEQTGSGIGKMTSTGWVNCPIPGAHPGRNVVNCIAQDKDGNLYLGTQGAGLYIFDSTCTSWTQPDSLPNPFIQAIAIDRKGDVWLGTYGGGACKLDRSKNLNSIRCFMQSNPGLADNIIRAIWIEAIGKGDIKWFGTNGGVSILDSTNTRWKTFTNANSGLGSDQIRDIEGDNDGNLWFTSVGLQSTGVSKLNNNWSELKIEDGLTSNFILAVEKDKGGRLWVGPYIVDNRFGGVLVLKDGDWKRVSLPMPLCTPQVSDFYPDETEMWVATTGCGILRVSNNLFATDIIRMNHPIGFPSNNVPTVVIRNDTLWAGTGAGLAQLLILNDGAELKRVFFASDSTFPDNFITALAHNSKGQLWVGTKQGLRVFDGTKWSEITNFPFAQNIDITALARDSTDAMWVSTNDGIARFDATKWTRFDIANGLPDNRITTISIAPDGAVWCGTPKGAAAFVDSTWTAYTTDDGLSENLISDIAFDPTTNVVWFATYGGGVSRYRKTQVRPETFLLERFDVVTETNVTFRYSGYDLNTPTENLRYQHALDNPLKLNESLITPATFVTLPVEKEGLHTFYVRAIDKDGKMDGSPAKFRFYKVLPERGGAAAIIDTACVQKFGSLWLYIPPNVLQRGDSIRATPVKFANTDTLPSGFTGIAYDLSPRDLVLKKNKPLTLAIFYGDTIKQDIDENKLVIYHSDHTSQWSRVGGTKDKNRRAITTTITQLGIYGLFKDKQATAYGPDLANVAAQPRILSPNGRGFLDRITISFDLGKSANVTAKVYNLSGRLVRALCENQSMNPGRNVIEWNGRDYNNTICSSGLYIVTIEAAGSMATKQVAVLNE